MLCSNEIESEVEVQRDPLCPLKTQYTDLQQTLVSSSFMKLPAELRNRIYEYLLLREPIISLTGARMMFLRGGIFKVNTQIHYEAKHAFLSINDFYSDDIKVTCSFLNSVGLPGRRAIRALTLTGDHHFAVRDFWTDCLIRLMLECTNLRTTTLYFLEDLLVLLVRTRPHASSHPAERLARVLELMSDGWLSELRHIRGLTMSVGRGDSASLPPIQEKLRTMLSAPRDG